MPNPNQKAKSNKKSGRQSFEQRLAALKYLPQQAGLVLIGGKRNLNLYLYDDKETTTYFQPQLVLWLDAKAETLRAETMVNPLHSTDNGLEETLEALLEAMVAPAVLLPPFPAATKSKKPGPQSQPKPGLPERIVVVDDPNLAQTISELFSPFKIKVEYATDPLPYFEDIFASLATALGASKEPISPPQPFSWPQLESREQDLALLYNAAARLWRLAPWDYASGDLPLALELGEEFGPDLATPTLYATVMGEGGMVVGVAFYPSLAAFEQARAQGEVQAEYDEQVEEAIARLAEEGLPVDELPPDMLHRTVEELLGAELGRPDKATYLQEMPQSWIVFYDKAEASDSTYLNWLKQHQLKYASKEAVPSFHCLQVGVGPRPLNVREVRAVGLALDGLGRFFKVHGEALEESEVPPAPDYAFRYLAGAGEPHTPRNEQVEVAVTFPAPGYEREYLQLIGYHPHLPPPSDRPRLGPGQFDIYEELYDEETGDLLDEEAAAHYRERLVERFTASPEGAQLAQSGEVWDWASTLLELAQNYLGISAPDIEVDDLQEVLFELFPRKVSVEAGAASQVMRELGVFFRFLEREYKLPYAGECLAFVEKPATTSRLKRELDNPANFGMAKSFIMQGQERGFDMSSEAGINAWMNTYNTELARGATPPLPLPDFFESGSISNKGTKRTASPKPHSKKDKARRKLAKLSRRKNRH